MYQILADYYDALVADPVAIALWVDFVQTHGYLQDVLEVACGTGEISLSLAEAGYDVLATDLSLAMLARAQQKSGAEKVTFQAMNLLKFELTKSYHNIICFCDSLNYLTDLADLKTFFQASYQSLLPAGVLMFDILAIDRLAEFQDPFIEEGQVLATDYQWVISTDEQQLVHQFTFWTAEGVKQEVHVQTIFAPLAVKALLEELGFEVTLWTDFINPGIQAGERYCFVAKKR